MRSGTIAFNQGNKLYDLLLGFFLRIVTQHIGHSGGVVTQVTAKWNSDLLTLPWLFSGSLAVHKGDTTCQKHNKNQRTIERLHGLFHCHDSWSWLSNALWLQSLEPWPWDFCALISKCPPYFPDPYTRIRSKFVHLSSFIQTEFTNAKCKQKLSACEYGSCVFFVLFTTFMCFSQSQGVRLIKDHAYQNHLSIRFNFASGRDWLITCAKQT